MSAPTIIGDAMCYLGDCLEVLRGLPDGSVDSVVTDPPYGIRFMGKSWDGADIDRKYIEANTDPDARARTGMAAAAGKYDLRLSAMKAFQLFSEEWAIEALRVLKPGGHLLCFAAARSYHRMATGIEDAGFEVRDQLMWLFGSGFPKSHNMPPLSLIDSRTEFTDGLGTALKPAHEPILMARKPLDGTVIANVLAHGTGGLNIAGCRIEHGEALRVGAGGTFETIPAHEGRESTRRSNKAEMGYHGGNTATTYETGSDDGRWPANVLHDGSDEVVALFPAEAGAFAPVLGSEPSAQTNGDILGIRHRVEGAYHDDTGSAARFFYCAKASKADRDEGMNRAQDRILAMSNQAKAELARGNMHSGESGMNTAKLRKNHHPTVKPTDLMRYLLRLVTPPSGIALDPFMGSGSTGKAALLEHFKFIGIERDPDYFAIATTRIEYIKKSGVQVGLFGEAA